MTVSAHVHGLADRTELWLDHWALGAPAGAAIGVAVSGGGDSIALLHLASDWAIRTGRTLHVLTVDHGVRPDARAEAEFVAALAQRLNWTSEILTWENGVPSARRARQARHTLLAKACRRQHITSLLLGHTQDDQFETILMRARQGSHWYGLGGMDSLSPAPVWPEGYGLTLVRPLLGEARSVLRDWLQWRGASWCDDPTNEDPAYERVRMRAHLAACEATRQQVARCVPQLSALRRAEQNALARLASTHVNHFPDASLDFDMSGVPQERAIRLLGVLAQVVAGRSTPPAKTRLGAALNGVMADGAARTLAGAWLVRRDVSTVSLYRDPGAMNAVEPGTWHFDGRFGRSVSQGSGRVGARDWRARQAVPPTEGAWHDLTRPRMAQMCAVWRQMQPLSHRSRP